MNERIRELAEQAFQPINDISIEGVADRHTFEQAWFQMYNQKFAELIVRECIAMCKTSVGNADYNTGRLHCLENIKEHFGVEE